MYTPVGLFVELCGVLYIKLDVNLIIDVLHGIDFRWCVSLHNLKVYDRTYYNAKVFGSIYDAHFGLYTNIYCCT